ncbi:MAG: polysaccharide biosynthesis protein, partial [Thermotoga sp.]
MLRKLILFLIDIGLTLFSGIVSLFMRFGFDFEEMGKYDESVIIYTLISSIVYILNGNYRIVWEYASPRDMLFLVRGSIISYLVNVTFFYFYRGSILPRSVGFSTFLGSLILLLLSRITWQWISNLRKGKAGEKRILIIGAGDAGIMLLEEFEKRPHLGKVVAFMDDSKRKIGRRIRGVPVFGPITETMKIVEKERIDEVIIAIPSATKEEMERILKAIDLRKIRVRTLPGIYELTDGRVRIGHLRDISIEDLLGREQVKVNLEEIGSYLKGRRVLVTGAGGSIGSELCRQIA